MRGLLGALLLAPALAAGLVVPKIEVEEWNGVVSSPEVQGDYSILPCRPNCKLITMIAKTELSPILVSQSHQQATSNHLMIDRVARYNSNSKFSVQKRHVDLGM